MVLIIGAGPTGLMAAWQLARSGIACRIIDKLATPVSTSNALAVQPSTLELWHKLGIVDEVISRGKKLSAFNIYDKHSKIAQLSFENVPLKFPFVLSLPQSETEKLLTEKLLEFEVEVERSVELLSFSEKNHHVISELSTGETVTSDWLLGCDGGHSTVRETLNIPFEGCKLPEHFIMTDAIIESDLPTDQMNIFFSSEGPFAIIPAGENFTRLIAQIEDDSITHPTIDDFKKLAQHRCTKNLTLKDAPWRTSFRVHRRLAKHYRKGRCFLAGDAAHLHSPVGGQGMNTGIQDAYCLSNLLSKVILEKKPDSILDDYEKQRQSVAKKVLRATTLGTTIISLHPRWLQIIRNKLIALLTKSQWFRHRFILMIAKGSQ